MKACRICTVEKAAQEYNKNRNECKACQKVNRRASYLRNRDKEIAAATLYNETHKEALKAHRKANPEINKRAAENHKPKRNARRRIKWKTDPLYKLKEQIRWNTRRHLKNKTTKKTVEILGCDYVTLKKHLEESFEARYGMPRSWITSFEVHIDHIIPISYGNTDEEILKLGHYTNLQYLLADDNRAKGNRYAG